VPESTRGHWVIGLTSFFLSPPLNLILCPVSASRKPYVNGITRMRILLLVYLQSLLLAAQANRRLKDHTAIRIEYSSAESVHIDELLESNVVEEVWQRRNVGASSHEIDLLVSQQQLKNVSSLISRRQLQARVLSSVFNNCYQAKHSSSLPPLLQPGEDFFADYRQLEDINIFLRSLETDYPTLASVFEIGTSWEGRGILAVRLTAPSSSPVQKPLVFLEAGIHSRYQHTSLHNCSTSSLCPHLSLPSPIPLLQRMDQSHVGTFYCLAAGTKLSVQCWGFWPRTSAHIVCW
jgi:hypothetical protein